MFSKLKKKAGEAIDSAKKDLNETAEKVQKTLDESGKSVKWVMAGTIIALGVSILCNIFTIGMSIHSTKVNRTRHQIVIEKMYLGGRPNGK